MFYSLCLDFICIVFGKETATNNYVDQKLQLQIQHFVVVIPTDNNQN